MFYSSNEINGHLFCLNCKNRFKEPKVLPCGSTICLDCEKKLLTWDGSTYECPICKRIHTKPEDNILPVNVLVKDILSLIPLNVYSDKLYEKAEGLLRNAQNLNQNLTLELENCKSHVLVHCDLLRNEIDIATESRIQKLNNYRDNFVQKIDKYEEKCLQKSQNSTDCVHSILQFTKNMELKFENYREAFNRPDLNDSELIEINNELTDLENKLIELSKKLNFCLFDKKLTFIEAPSELKPCDIGSLSQYISSTRVDINKLNKLPKPIEYEYTQKRSDYYELIDISPFDSNSFLLSLVRSTDSFNTEITYSIKTKLVSHTGSLINECQKFVTFIKPNGVILKCFQSKILLAYHSDDGFYIIEIFDKNLKSDEESVGNGTDYKIESIETNENGNVFLISTDSEPLIHVLDENLDEFDSFGQNTDMHKEFFLKDYYSISIKDAFIFLQKTNSVEIIDRITGLLANKIQFKNSIDSYLFEADSNSTFIMFDTTARLFQLYDFDGELLHELSFNDIKTISKFIVTKQGGLAILDSQARKVYIY